MKVNEMRKDITSREDIELLVNSFYTSVQHDPLIGPIFNDIANVDWNLHLPKMYDFFETIILGNRGFKGNPMEVHFKLNQQFQLKPEHFDRWKSLFYENVDINFEGENASAAKQKASSIADLMFFKISVQNGDKPIINFKNKF